MKKTILSMFLLIALLCIGFAYAETRTGVPVVKVTMINQEPDPVAPGNIVLANFRIENTGTGSLEDMEVKLVLNDKIEYYGSEPEIRDIGTVTGSQTSDVGVRQSFRLYVKEDAATGPNIIEFWYKTKNSDWTKYSDYSINVRQREVLVAINQINTESNIAPGSTTKVSFRIENLANTNVRNIKLKLDFLSPIVTSASVTYRELPFTPLGSGNEKMVKLLAPSRFEDVYFNLFTDATAEAKIYKVPYALTYSDDYGANFTETGIVGLLVSSKPELSLNVDSSSIYAAGTSGRVVVKIVNKGFNGVKFINLKLADSNDYEIYSSPVVYIGKLDSDDYETADFDLNLQKNAPKEIALPITVEYKDANGKPYSETVSLSLKVNSNQNQGSRAGSLFWLFILVIVIAVGLFFYLRRRRRQKK